MKEYLKLECIFDKDKLDWVNGHHIRNYDIDKLTDLAIPYLIESGYIDENTVKERYDWVKAIVITIRESIQSFRNTRKVEIFLNNKIEPEDENALEMLKGEQVPSLLNAFKEELDKIEEIDEEFSKGIMKKKFKSHRCKRQELIYAC